MRIFAYIVLLLVLILGITFAYLNADGVIVNYYIGEKQVPLSLLLLLTLGIGLLIGVLSMVIPLIKLKHKNVKIQKKLKQAQKEVENLRAIPVKQC
jgi:uncharacterized membrane protein YciS (DUF1049 family)